MTKDEKIGETEDGRDIKVEKESPATSSGGGEVMSGLVGLVGWIFGLLLPGAFVSLVVIRSLGISESSTLGSVIGVVFTFSLPTALVVWWVYDNL